MEPSDVVRDFQFKNWATNNFCGCVADTDRNPHFISLCLVKKSTMISPTSKFEHLESAIQEIEVPGPSELAARIAALPKAGRLFNPVATWLFINLMRYRRRQRWARKQLQEHFPRFFVGEGKLVALQVGMTIPGMPDWMLDWSGSDVGSIVHKLTGEEIVLGRAKDSTESIVFPGGMLRSVPSSSPWDVPGRLAAAKLGRRSVPSIAPWDITGQRFAAVRAWEVEFATTELVAARVLLETYFDGSPFEEKGEADAHRLSRMACAVARSVSTFCRLWKEPHNRLWLAALVGDWPSANELVQSHLDPQVRRTVGERFEAYRQRRLAIARFNLDLEADSIYDMEVLFRGGAEDFEDYVQRFLAAAGSDWRLSELLLETGDSRWNEQLFKTFERSSANCEHFPIPRLAWTLLERGYRTDDVLAGLEKCDQGICQAALLLLKYAPARALPLVHKALREESPTATKRAAEGRPRGYSGSCLVMAAALAAIDEPWSRREILDAINEFWARYEDPSILGPLALALSESRDAALREVGDSWQAKCSGWEEWPSVQRFFSQVTNQVFHEAIALRGVSVGAEPGPQPGGGT